MVEFRDHISGQKVILDIKFNFGLEFQDYMFWFNSMFKRTGLEVQDYKTMEKQLKVIVGKTINGNLIN